MIKPMFLLHLHNPSVEAAVAQILLRKDRSSGSFGSFGLLRLLLLLFGGVLAQVEESWSEELWLLLRFRFLNDFHLDSENS